MINNKSLLAALISLTIPSAYPAYTCLDTNGREIIVTRRHDERCAVRHRPKYIGLTDISVMGGSNKTTAKPFDPYAIMNPAEPPSPVMQDLRDTLERESSDAPDLTK
jgi:hypothetical protein